MWKETIAIIAITSFGSFLLYLLLRQPAGYIGIKDGYWLLAFVCILWVLANHGYWLKVVIKDNERRKT